MKPYATGAPVYQMAGWRGILPLPVGQKASPPSGYTGRTGTDPATEQVTAWLAEETGNIALRLPDGVLGIDVDAYGAKDGAASLAALERNYGDLPATWRSSARADDAVSGIRFYQVPAGLDWSEAAAGPGIDLVRHDHRYAVVWPSLHPGDDWVEPGAQYRWYSPDGEPVEIGVPSIDQLPELPARWVARLSRGGVDDQSDKSEQLGPPANSKASSEWASGAATGEAFGPPARSFTRGEAIEFCRPALDALRRAEDGEINNRLNDAAVQLGHFAGIEGFWSLADARQWLESALAETVYDGRTWRAAATIESGLGASDWRATWVADAAAGVGASIASDAVSDGGEQAVDAVDALYAELLDSEALEGLPTPVPLIDGWLWRDSTGSVIGKSGDGKSFVALGMAAAIGGGHRWHGALAEMGEAWLIVAEGASGVRKRVRAWEKAHGVRMVGVRVLPRPVQAASPEWLTLIALARRERPAAVFVDTQARVTVGLDENSNTEMGMFVARLEMLREASGACVMAVHHIGHNGEHGRGASALKGAWTSELRVSKARAPEGSDVAYVVRVECTKSKDDAEPEPLELPMRVVELGDDDRGRPVTSIVLMRDPLVDMGIVAAKPRASRIDVLTDEALIGKAWGQLAEVMRRVAPNVGMTQAVACGMARTEYGMSKPTAYRAWDKLVKGGVIARIAKSERWRHVPVDERETIT